MKRTGRTMSPEMRASAVREGQLIALGMLSLRWVRAAREPAPDMTSQRAAILARIDLRAVPRPQRAAYGIAVESIALETLRQAEPMFHIGAGRDAKPSEPVQQAADREDAAVLG